MRLPNTSSNPASSTGSWLSTCGSTTTASWYSGRDGESQTADAWNAPHLVGLNGNPIEARRSSSAHRVRRRAKPSATRNASPSSGLRSSITISACGGNGRARRSSSSTGTSRHGSTTGSSDTTESSGRQQLRSPSAERCPLAQHDEGSLRRRALFALRPICSEEGGDTLVRHAGPVAISTETFAPG